MRKRSDVRQQKLPTADLLAGLNPEQIEVVNAGAGTWRVLALAGSGKTESLARRIANLVLSGVDPARILAVTFTKKGAEEMQYRIASKFGVSGSRVGTWHSFCLQVLREDNTEEGSWTIEDSGPGTSTKVLMKEQIGWRGMNWKGADVSKLMKFVGCCKAELYEPETDDALELAREIFNWEASKAVEAFSRFNDACREKGLLTFDDFLVFVARHFEDEDNRTRWAARYDYVMQDEQQDANRAQKVIAHQLSRDHGNYMVIGDVFQAIYGFRGSTPDFLAKFDQEWPAAKTIVLPRNYRSGRKIIDVANAILAHARIDGLAEPGRLVGERDIDGEVRIVSSESLDDEGNVFASAIKGSVAAGDSKFADHTILYRTNAQSRALEEALLSERIPYMIVGGTSFYERKEVRDLLAYLRLAAGRGATEDVKRSINTPFRSLGAKFVERVMGAVEDQLEDGVDWPVIVEDVARQDRIQDRQRQSAREWGNIVRKMQSLVDAGAVDDASDIAKDDARPARLLDYVVKQTRYVDYLVKEEGDETTENSHAANVREMVRVAERFPTAAELLDYIDDTIKSARKQKQNNQAGGDRVTLMSFHRSKGLEWPFVYVAGMNESILPHAKGDDQEERRLAYVAVTRARDILTLSYVRRIAMKGGIKDVYPSRFIVETGLPLDVPKGTEVETSPGDGVPPDGDAFDAFELGGAGSA